MRAGSTKRSSGTINKDGLNSHTRHFLVQSNKKSKTPRQDTPKWSFISSELSVCAHACVCAVDEEKPSIQFIRFLWKKNWWSLKILWTPKHNFGFFIISLTSCSDFFIGKVQNPEDKTDETDLSEGELQEGVRGTPTIPAGSCTVWGAGWHRAFTPLRLLRSKQGERGIALMTHLTVLAKRSFLPGAV